MKVLVLGCGPAGLIAAHAAVRHGNYVKVISKPRKSFMKGAQYLHEPIPGIDCGDPFTVHYDLRGTLTGYRYKVYGRQWDGTVSPEDLATTHQGWDIRRAYDDLWSIYGKYIEEWEATPASLHNWIERLKPDMVVSSIPANFLCAKGHTFRSTSIYSNDQEVTPIDNNSVICNGEESPHWYRTARIQDWITTEWPGGKRPPFENMFNVLKPTDNNCDCFPNVLRVGRYGSWKKGVLSHTAFQEVSKRCQPSLPTL